MAHNYNRPGAANSALLTDLYELTMAQSYVSEGMFAPATFSLFVRQLPSNRGYLVAAGLEDVLRYLEEIHFSASDVDYLRSTGLFQSNFLEYLREFRFKGDVWAMPEGRLFFANEPILEITASMPEAQLVETYVINQINFQSMVATKAARCVWAALGRSIVDFSLRRAHGTDAGMKAARSSYLAGCTSTSNVLAGQVYGIPTAGTMAHSYVSSFPHEIDAFRAYARSFPNNTILLIDTYDTLAGARNAAAVAKEMETQGHRLKAVRLDSGDLTTLSRQVWYILDHAGLGYVDILASGGLDEYQVQEMVAAYAPVNGFGIGTKMGISADAPWLDMAYKLVKYNGKPTLKLSTDKVSLAGEKQAYRMRDPYGTFQADILALRTEPPPSGEPLLSKVMENGHVVGHTPSLEESRLRFREEFASLPELYKALKGAPEYPVQMSPGLRQLQESLLQQTSSTQGGP